MGQVVGITLQKGDFKPYVGTDVGVFMGEKHKKVAITGDCDATNKAFILPAANVPYMDTNNDGTVDKADIVVYDDGVAVEITTFDPATRTATLATAPAVSSVMTADFTEIHEFIIATDFDLKDKPKSQTWSMLRSNDETTIYTGSNPTLSVNMDIAGKDMVALGFDDVTKEKLDTPRQVSVAIIFFKRDTDELDWGFFAETADLVFDDLAKVKSLDIGTFSAELSIRSTIKLLSMASYPINSGVVATP